MRWYNTTEAADGTVFPYHLAYLGQSAQSLGPLRQGKILQIPRLFPPVSVLQTWCYAQ